MYYGFQTEEEWLIYYTKTHRDAYDMPISRSSVFNIGYAIDILKIQTGIKTLSGEQFMLWEIYLRMGFLLSRSAPTSSLRSKSTKSSTGGSFEADLGCGRAKVVAA